jgi:hypothetical protein
MAERAFTSLCNNLDRRYRDLGEKDGDLTLLFVLKRYQHRLRTDGTLIDSAIGTNNCPSENALSLLNLHACLAGLLAMKHEKALPAQNDKNPSLKLVFNILDQFSNSKKENQKLFEQYLFCADAEARRVLDDLAQNNVCDIRLC